jgi:hypothetical protein
MVNVVCGNMNCNTGDTSNARTLLRKHNPSQQHASIGATWYQLEMMQPQIEMEQVVSGNTY